MNLRGRIGVPPVLLLVYADAGQAGRPVLPRSWGAMRENVFRRSLSPALIAK